MIAREASLRLPERLHPLDWLAIGLFVAGAVCVSVGALPSAEFTDIWHRIVPLLIFLGSVVVLAELTADAEVFDVIASRIAIAGRGHYGALFLLCVLFASLSTMLLNLDTTAVLITPVMLVLARRIGIAALPLAMTTVWLANTASLMLPVSNLTNLLAHDQVALAPLHWAERMWPAQLVAITVTMVFLWLFFWRRGVRDGDAYHPGIVHRPRDPVLFRVACVACGLFLVGVLIDLPLHVVSPVAAAVLGVAYSRRRPARLGVALVPWRLLLMVPGLFLVVGTVGAHGLDDVMHALSGDHADVGGSLRAALTGATMSNLVNNLPAYLAGEETVADLGPQQVLALLVGVNIGPLVTPWASLATLIWFERCQAHGVRVPIRTFVLTGTVTAVAGLVATTMTLVATGH